MITRGVIDAILGPSLAAAAARNGDAYRQIRAGLIAEAIGTLMSGASRKAVKRQRQRIVRELAALQS